MNVVTLLPSATELVCAAGGRELLVGRSHECDHPVGVEALPSLTRSRVRFDLPSGEIDGDVRRLRGLSFKDGVWERTGREILDLAGIPAGAAADGA